MAWMAYDFRSAPAQKARPWPVMMTALECVRKAVIGGEKEWTKGRARRRTSARGRRGRYGAARRRR